MTFPSQSHGVSLVRRISPSAPRGGFIYRREDSGRGSLLIDRGEVRVIITSLLTGLELSSIICFGPRGLNYLLE